jgi:integral membrane protein
MLKTPIGRLRAIAFLEGVSYLLLLGIAMPLKYFADLPEAVKLVGSLHGLFFVLYIIAVAHVTVAVRWSIARVLGALAASVIPFGTFVLDARLRRNHLEG